MDDEKTIYDNEKTQYQSQDEEATQYDDASGKESKQPEKVETQDSKNVESGEKQQPIWKKVALGAGSGILLGASATLFSSSTLMEYAEGGEGSSHTDWTDGEVPVAPSVNDEMSFSEAFNAARTEVGSGGVFEWHGNIYSTFTEEEWNGMSSEQRGEYGRHFNFHSDTASESHPSNTSHDATTTDEVEVVAANDNHDQTNQGHDANYNEAEVADVTPAENATEEIPVVDVEPEVEVLGVVHDDETGASIGGLVVDDQEVVLIDVDGDSTFDVMGADVNGDQQLSQDEIVDISDQNVTVDDLGGFSNPDDPMCVSDGNEINNTNDADVYDL